jgi:spore maturation protein CgeB
MLEKIRYFLDHPKEREEIAKNARTRVLKEHTFKDRMERVVEVVNKI